MKKLVILGAALLLGVLLAVAAAPWGLPDPSGVAASSAKQPDGLIYLAENRALESRIYTVDQAGTVLDLYRERRNENSFISQISWDGSALCFLRESPQEDGSVLWETLRIEAGEAVTSTGRVKASGYRATGLSGSDFVTAVPLDGSGGAAVYQTSGDGSALRIEPRPAAERILSAAYLPEEDALRVHLDTGTSLLLKPSGATPIMEGSLTPPVLQMTLPLFMRLNCKLPLIATAVLAFFALYLPFSLAVQLYQRAKRLAMRAAAVCTLCLLLGWYVLSGLMMARGVEIRRSVQLSETGRLAAQLVAVLPAAGADGIRSDQFYSSQAQDALLQVLSTANAALFSLRGEAAAVAVSNQLPYGLPAQDCPYGLADLIAKAAQGSPVVESRMVRGRPVAFCAQPVRSNRAVVGVLVLYNSQLAVGSVKSATLYLCSGLAAVAVCSLILGVLLVRLTRPVVRLSQQIERIARGDLTPSPCGSLQDELGSMERRIQELCVGLSIREYESSATLRSYQRFVPPGLDGLLGRASIMEVSFGDAQSIPAMTGILSVCNAKAARASLEDGPFMEFVDSCFLRVSQNLAAYNGFRLSAGYGLAAFKLCYCCQADQAVSAGLALISCTDQKQDVLCPDFLLLLHSTEFLYGIVGTEQEAFPFLSSAELDFLSGFSPYFKEAGVRLVLTEELFKQLGTGFSIRYLGYVTEPESGREYKLYEVLDGYPEQARELRARYNTRLQEAIELYYHNDFYLARNLFSTLLRACPDDGIARWYLFACEHYFHCSNQDAADHQLFGVAL